MASSTLTSRPILPATKLLPGSAAFSELKRPATAAHWIPRSQVSCHHALHLIPHSPKRRVLFADSACFGLGLYDLMKT